MEPDLFSEYTAIKKGTKKANAFSKLIKNNEELKKELHSKSLDISELYSNPSEVQRLKFLKETSKKK